MAAAQPGLPSTEHLFDQVPCGLVFTNLGGTILRVNRTLCNWLGMRSEDLVGQRTLSDLFTMGGRIFHQTHWMPMLQMQGSLSEVKLDLRHADGRTIPMMLNAIRRVDADGQGHDEVVLTVANERNKYERELLAERKRADDLLLQAQQVQAALKVTQSRLGQALSGGALFVWGVEGKTRRRVYSPEVALLLGHAEPQAIPEDALLTGLADAERREEHAALEDVLLDGSRKFGWRYVLPGIDGRTRTIAASGQAFLNEDGSLAQFVGLLQDITPLEDLRAAAEDRALFAEQMVGIVSHDLRNPLSAILIGTRLLSGDLPVPEDRKPKLLGHIANSAERAQRLISELLDFTAARVGTGLSVSRQPIELHEFVGGVVDELMLAFPGRTLVHRSIGEGASTAAPDRLAQLLGNLVGNAFAYGAEDTVVTVTSELRDDWALLSVHNFGPEIPHELRGSLFEPMVRGEVMGNRMRSVGLGLFIVQAIAHAHHGTVTVTSTAHGGTEFVCRYPRG